MLLSVYCIYSYAQCTWIDMINVKVSTNEHICNGIAAQIHSKLSITVYTVEREKQELEMTFAAENKKKYVKGKVCE